MLHCLSADGTQREVGKQIREMLTVSIIKHRCCLLCNSRIGTSIIQLCCCFIHICYKHIFIHKRTLYLAR